MPPTDAQVAREGLGDLGKTIGQGTTQVLGFMRGEADRFERLGQRIEAKTDEDRERLKMQGTPQVRRAPAPYIGAPPPGASKAWQPATYGQVYGLLSSAARNTLTSDRKASAALMDAARRVRSDAAASKEPAGATIRRLRNATMAAIATAYRLGSSALASQAQRMRAGGAAALGFVKGAAKRGAQLADRAIATAGDSSKWLALGLAGAAIVVVGGVVAAVALK